MDEFSGMSEKESALFQLENWVSGIPLHNSIRDECCPDFSCCNGGKMIPFKTRLKFQKACAEDDKQRMWAILGMALSGLASDEEVKVRIAGDNPEEH